MICRSCGTEIADKAIVCYRCGTGTTEPLRKPAEIRRRRTPVWVWLVVVLAILLALFVGRTYHLFGLDVVALTAAGGARPVLIDCPPGNA